MAREFPFYRLATIGWANPLLRSTVSLLDDPPDELAIDLSAVTFADSFGITYLAACVHRTLGRGATVWIRPPRAPAVNRYLQDVGFYQSIGIAEHFPARSPSSAQRVDLVHIRALEPMFIDRLLTFLEEGVGPFETGLRPSMRLSLMELVQNFAEHSGSSAGAWACGQVHRYSKETRAPRVTLCLLDLGHGIPDKLRTVERFRRSADAELVQLATEEGVSSVDESRGRGLSTIRRFARANGGAMTIVAGRARVRFRADRHPEGSALDERFPGTAVFLSLVPTGQGLYVLK